MAGLATEDIMLLIEGGAKADTRLFVEFDTKSVEDPAATLEVGIPQFKDLLYVRIGAPGDPNSILHRAATVCNAKRGCAFLRGGANDVPCDLHRFPRQYAAFQGDLDQQEASGMPLSAWPILGKAQVAMLKAQRIHTVEQLAGINDSALSNIGPIRSLIQQAKDFLEAARGQAPLLRMRKEMEDKDAQIAALQGAVEQMGKKVEELAGKVGKGRSA
jgi:hypothetical protein